MRAWGSRAQLLAVAVGSAVGGVNGARASTGSRGRQAHGAISRSSSSSPRRACARSIATGGTRARTGTTTASQVARTARPRSGPRCTCSARSNGIAQAAPTAGQQARGRLVRGPRLPRVLEPAGRPHQAHAPPHRRLRSEHARGRQRSCARLLRRQRLARARLPRGLPRDARQALPHLRATTPSSSSPRQAGRTGDGGGVWWDTKHTSRSSEGIASATAARRAVVRDHPPEAVPDHGRRYIAWADSHIWDAQNGLYMRDPARRF